MNVLTGKSIQFWFQSYHIVAVEWKMYAEQCHTETSANRVHIYITDDFTCHAQVRPFYLTAYVAKINVFTLGFYSITNLNDQARKRGLRNVSRSIFFAISSQIEYRDRDT